MIQITLAGVPLYDSGMNMVQAWCRFFFSGLGVARLRVGRWLLLAGLATGAVLAQAAPVPGEGDITLSTRFWIDTSGSAGVDEAVGRPSSDWAPMERFRSFQLGESALWIRIEPGALDAGRRWYLLLTASAFTNRVSLFSRGRDGQWTEQRSGDHLPVAQWDHPDQTPVFAVDPQGGEAVWLRILNSPTPTSPHFFQPLLSFRVFNRARSAPSSDISFNLYE